ncbi:hypothetical protein ASE63_22530 [Bosea sp. Root381]|uniref:hypothetical protein n=1 Tax=Bosea sp. Root381 TaxID=1736524 RepID=UPI0006F30470|nr:hypothetical protein [Bosea sp. Root381]KRE07479.1 hypothetical protein ASE63_22530 [Bosea sp. Root381]
MALPESLSPENVIGTLAAGIAIAIVMVRQYLKERKAPTSPTGDRVIPGITIADMNPIRELASEQARTTAANERIATAVEALLSLLHKQDSDERVQVEAKRIAREMRDDEIEDEVERRIRQRLDDRKRRTARP